MNLDSLARLIEIWIFSIQILQLALGAFENAQMRGENREQNKQPPKQPILRRSFLAVHLIS
jgi:hypothetical protein